jgi:hypothetical protein
VLLTVLNSTAVESTCTVRHLARHASQLVCKLHCLLHCSCRPLPQDRQLHLRPVTGVTGVTGEE